jgi:hypothetical protein
MDNPTKLPRLFRPYRSLLVSAFHLLADDQYIGMSEAEFVSAMMRESGGTLDPSVVADLYQRLMEEAGIAH